MPQKKISWGRNSPNPVLIRYSGKNQLIRYSEKKQHSKPSNIDSTGSRPEYPRNIPEY